MKKSVVAALFSMNLFGAGAATSVSDHELSRPEGARHYLLAQPAPDAGASLPLVILLHGHGASAAWMVGRESFAGYTTQDWMRLAGREKILLIAPQGVKGSDGKAAWNDCRADATTNAETDDVGFIAALIDKAVAEHRADPRRIYVFGTSNGGAMAYRLGIELGPRLAAIGVQSALMPARSKCQPPAHPLPVFITHGTADKIAPYAGGDVAHSALRGRGTGLSVDESAAIWRRLARLPETATLYRYPHAELSKGTSATRYLWGSDPAQLQVALLRIEGGGHTHSSTSETLPWLLGKLLGEVNHDVDTSDAAWEFFRDKRAAPHD
jgi:polyhydroxybutyrate depolymerase